MTFPKIRRACARLRKAAKKLWSWYHNQMDHNDRYGRTLLQGVVRALWQETLERFGGVLLAVFIELLKILREDGLNPRGASRA